MSKATRFTDGEFTGDLHVGGNLTVDGTYPSGGGGGGGSGGLVVHETLETVGEDEMYVLDKTYNEILASFSSGASVVIITEYGEVCSVIECYPAGDEFVVVGFYEPVNKYFAFDGDDYPSARA